MRIYSIILSSFIGIVLTMFVSTEFANASGLPDLIEVRKVKGAGEFAAQVEELFRTYRKVGLVLDNDGVMNDQSMPKDDSFKSRGDMVDYVKFLVARSQDPHLDLPFELSLVVASALPIEDVLRRVRRFGLDDVLGLEGEIKRGLKQFGQSTCNFAKQGKVACIQRISTKLGVKNDYTYNRQKAFTLGEVYGNKDFDLVIYAEDSGYNIKVFQQDIDEAYFYPTVKKIVIFEFPQIDGESLESDKIAEEHLPLTFRSRPDSPNPLASSGYWPREDEGEDASSDSFRRDDNKTRSAATGISSDAMFPFVEARPLMSTKERSPLSRSMGHCAEEAGPASAEEMIKKEGRDELVHSQ